MRSRISAFAFSCLPASLAMATSTLDRAVSESEYRSRLLSALGGSGEGWEWSGDVSDTGPHSGATCACGHLIRYAYVLSHAVRGTCVVGSTCVENAPGMSASSLERIRAHVAALQAAENEKKRLAREAFRKAELEGYIQAFEAVFNLAKAQREAAERRYPGWKPSAVYYALRGLPFPQRLARETAEAIMRGVKTTAGQRKRIERATQDYRAAIEEMRTALSAS